MADDAGMMADLEKAWDTVEKETPDDTTETEILKPGGQHDGSAEEPAGAGGSGSGTERQPDKPEGNADTAAVGKNAQRDAKSATGAEGANASLEVAPQNLPPAAREVWKKTPLAMREAVIKRELDYRRSIDAHATNAKRAEQMDQVLHPFGQFFAINGNRPAETVSGILQTAATLQMGSPAQRAQTIASLVKQFGVDIHMLDSALVGEQPQENQLESLLNQRLQPIQQQLQHYQQREQHEQQQSFQRISNEVTAFGADPKNEFYQEVRGEMADIMDLASNQGRAITLKEAYEKACQLHPEIAPILRSRQSAQHVNQNRRVASSIHGGPGGEGSTAPPDSMRAALEQAWDTAAAG